MSDQSPPQEGPGPAPGYNTHAVERLTGVRATTFRAWERRYGVPSPRRLPGGQRVYGERDVAVVRWLRQQTERGLSASFAVAQLRQMPGTVEQPATQAAFGPLELAEGMVQAALAFDSTTLEGLLSQALAAHTLETVCLEVIQPTLVNLGERWHRGDISPAVEHFATALVRRRLEQLAALLDTGNGRPLIVMGTAPEEQHEIGVLILSLFLRRRGLRVTYLGPNVTAGAAVEVSRRMRPEMVCLSATTLESAGALQGIGQALAALDPPRPRFAFGGQAFQTDPALAKGIPGIYFAGDANEATGAVEALLRE